MRKAGIILLILLYQMLSIGVSIHAHYCLGYLDSLTFFEQQDDPCPCPTKMGCCEDKSVTLKIDDAQQGLSFPEIPSPFAWTCIPKETNENVVSGWEPQALHLSYQKAPEPPGPPPYVRFQAFLHYG